MPHTTQGKVRRGRGSLHFQIIERTPEAAARGECALQAVNGAEVCVEKCVIRLNRSSAWVVAIPGTESALRVNLSTRHGIGERGIELGRRQEAQISDIETMELIKEGAFLRLRTQKGDTRILG